MISPESECGAPNGGERYLLDMRGPPTGVPPSPFSIAWPAAGEYSAPSYRRQKNVNFTAEYDYLTIRMTIGS